MENGNNLNVDLKATTSIKGFDGGILFGQGIILRHVSKFISPSGKEGVLPIPVFYDIETKKILEGSVPEDLREEYKEYIFNGENS